MLTRGDDKRPKFFVKGPIVVLAAIAALAAVVEIVIIADQVRETRNPLGPIMINSKANIWRTAVGLPAVHADACKFGLQIALVALVVFEPSRRELTKVFRFWILKQNHS